MPNRLIQRSRRRTDNPGPQRPDGKRLPESPPSVLIVVPTLATRPDWLDQTISSIRGQRSVDVRLLIVAPSAAQESLAALYGSESIKPVDKRGLSHAINSGFTESSADYLTWIGDDDILAPNSVSAMVRKLEECREAPFGFGRTRYISANGDTIGVTRLGWLAPSVLKYGKDFIPQPGSLIRRTALERTGYLDESLANAMDLDIFIRLSRLGRPAYLAKEVSAYRLHDTSITMTKGQRDEGEWVRQQSQGRIASATYRYWRPPLQVIDRIWDIANRRLPARKPVAQYTRGMRSQSET